MDPVFLNCQFSLGAFSGERVFEVKQLNGETYIGLSPLHYCYHQEGGGLGPSEPQQGLSITGKLAARKIGVVTEGARVTIPDGRAISVPVDLISVRVSRGPHVPV
jgi:hypothetical protein